MDDLTPEHEQRLHVARTLASERIEADRALAAERARHEKVLSFRTNLFTATASILIALVGAGGAIYAAKVGRKLDDNKGKKKMLFTI